VKAIANELSNFSEDLAEKPRWLVINKIDLLDDDDRVAAREKLLESLEWDGPVFEVSAATGEGTDALGQAIVRELEALQEFEE
jgi:GTP-binding protein